MWGGGFSTDYSAPDVGFSGGGLDGFTNDGYGAPAGWSGGTGDFASGGAEFSGVPDGGFTVSGMDTAPVTFNSPAPTYNAQPDGPYFTTNPTSLSQPRNRLGSTITRPYAPDATWIERNLGAVVGGLGGLALGGPIGLIGGVMGGDRLYERIRGMGIDEEEDPENPNARYDPIAQTNDMFHDFWSRMGDVDYSPPPDPQTGGDSVGDYASPGGSTPAPGAGLEDVPPAQAEVAAPTGNPLLDAPELLYGPYFDPTTGGFTRGAAPFQNIADRYRVTRAGV